MTLEKRGRLEPKMGANGETQLLRQRTAKGRLCLQHSGNVYDVTDFASRHPGGKDWVTKYSGCDVTEIMQQSSPHRHTKAAYSIMQKYRITDEQVDICKQTPPSLPNPHLPPQLPTEHILILSTGFSV